ncbi:lytic murein transglycosylase B [Halomonas organivorans]|uniref:Membrane-bound lytic murein transglycosylase B n=1 Tax=Halomonas organivorans TaxID=257772 RepID=A0A7W5BVV1_9GAMM|nr:lytic murein transglycosylase B [Halomonas organivorans]MBB3140097.1 membrane-bound lytic murein transglycosylase B [Halomonas organivorans]
MTVTTLPRGRRALILALGGLVFWMSAGASAADFDPRRGEVRALVDDVAERGVDRDWLEDALDRAEFRQEVLDAMSGAAEHHLVWHEYRDIFLGEERIAQGAAFIDAHREAFARAEDEYGVPPEIIAAILGVETRYGKITGDHRVLDSLSTLAFHHPRRGAFFRDELAAFLEIAFQQEVAPESIEGSYAGAMGYPQFIPTSYRAYAVDFDGDGHRNLWTDPVDAIGSIGNYFAEHHWRAGAPIYHEAQGPAEPPEAIRFNEARPPGTRLAELERAGIVSEAALPDDVDVMPLALDMADGTVRYRLGRDNFYVITRYNHSYLYAMAVTELAEAIAEARGRQADWFTATAADPEESP